MSATMIEAKFTTLTESASRLGALLEKQTPARARETYAQLVTLQSRLRQQRRLSEQAAVTAAQARVTRRDLEKRVQAGITSSITLGQAFGIEELVDFRHQARAWHLTLEELERVFAREGDFGREFARRLNELGDAYRRAVEGEAQSTAAHAQAVREFTATFFELQGLVNLARSVLQLAGVALPPGPSRKKRKIAKVVSPAATAPLTVVTPAPAPSLAVA